MASKTRCAFSGFTVVTPAMTLETVAADTPARLATSWIDGRRCWSCLCAIGPPPEARTEAFSARLRMSKSIFRSCKSFHQRYFSRRAICHPRSIQRFCDNDMCKAKTRGSIAPGGIVMPNTDLPLIISAPEPRTLELIFTPPQLARLKVHYRIVETTAEGVAKLPADVLGEARYIIGQPPISEE